MGDFGKNLKNIRMGQNLTQQELADKLGVTRPTISGYETKGKEPNYEMLVKIADVLHVTTDDLLWKTEPGSMEKAEGKKTEIPEKFKKSNIPDIGDMISAWEKTMQACQKLIVYAYGTAEQKKIGTADWEKFDNYININKLMEMVMRAEKQAEHVATAEFVKKAESFEEIESAYAEAKKDCEKREVRIKNYIKREFEDYSPVWEGYLYMKDWLGLAIETGLELFELNIGTDKISYLKKLLLNAKSYGYESKSTLE